MPGLLRGVARTAVIAGTATSVSNRVSRRQARRWAAEEPQPDYEEQAPPPPPQQAAPAEPSYMAELEQLAHLRDQGVITADDFEAKKRQLLGLDAA